MNDAGQYMVQVGGDFDQNTYIIQDANGLPVQYEGGTIIQGELSDGNNLLGENRWIQQSGGRGGKILSSQNYLNGDLVSVNGTGLNLNTRYTPSSIVLNSSTAGTQFDQDNLRIATAVSGAGGRGRPRGRKPSRGNFPVVPIDMVRQLGIEQQVILQPTVPVAMKNKTTMCKPLLMSKKTQCNENDLSGLSNTCTEATIKYIYTPVFVPVPVPVYIPVPTFIKVKSQQKDAEINLEVTESSIDDSVDITYHEESTLLPSSDLQLEDTKVIESLQFTAPSEDTKIIESIQFTAPSDDTKIIESIQFTASSEDTKVIESIQFTASSEEPLTIVATETENISEIYNVSEVIQESKKRPNTDEDFSVAKHRKLDTSVIEKKDVDSYKLKYSFGINAWRHWSKNVDLLKLSVTEINAQLEEFVQKIRKPNSEVYVPDSILYLCLGIQLFLIEHDYDLNLFIDPRMATFQFELNKILATFKPKLSDQQVLICRIEEDHLWESQQFGVISPGVLIFSVCYLLTRQLKLKNGLEHSELNLNQMEVTDSQVIVRTKATNEPFVVCERTNSNRCFYSILSAYVDKCNDSKKAMEVDGDRRIDDSLYLTPLEKEDKSDLATCLWYDPVAIDVSQLDMMLNRIRIVKEVQESILSSII